MTAVGPMANLPSDLTPASGWTTETLHVHMTTLLNAEIRRHETMLDEREKAMRVAFEVQDRAMNAAFVAAEKAVEAALEATQKAIDKAEAADNKRFDSMNEFRGQLSDQAATLMPRAESLALHKRAQEDIAELKERAWQSQGAAAGNVENRNRQNATTNVVIGIVGLIIAVLVILLNLYTG